jgi:hypothetical protein
MAEKKLYAYAPNGSPIKGTYEYVPGCALARVSKSPATGEVDVLHGGETEMFWEDQWTVHWNDQGTYVHPYRHADAPKEKTEPVYVAEDGELYRESELVWKETNPEEAGDDGEG